MNLRRALFIAACLLPLAAAGPARGAVPADAAAARSRSRSRPASRNSCKLRDDAAEEGGRRSRRASERKATPKEACELFNAFSAAEVKMIKYRHRQFGLVRHSRRRSSSNMKKAHAKTATIRTKVCQAAAAPQRGRRRRA